MKSVIEPIRLIASGAMTGTSVITSPAVRIARHDNVSIQCAWTGTPAGSFAVQASLDYQQNPDGSVANAGTWTNITLPSTPSASGSAGSVVLDLNQLSFPWVRVQYTNTSGSGTLNCYLSAKEV
jgi:hypothetical protein